MLRASYFVTLLAAHHENFSRRIVKTPKLYFLDTACCAPCSACATPMTSGTTGARPRRAPVVGVHVGGG